MLIPDIFLDAVSEGEKAHCPVPVGGIKSEGCGRSGGQLACKHLNPSPSPSFSV